ncbi:MAG: hypothetical protein FVQ82_14525 [Planctomycetes bacterium]|nr:hypothetical protein [Planctomycetota bacterium]
MHFFTFSQRQITQTTENYPKGRFVYPTADDDIYVGIDVHKVDYHVAIWLNNGIALTFVAPADNSAIARELEKLTPGLKQVVFSLFLLLCTALRFTGC